jgi:hypothetical protein
MRPKADWKFLGNLGDASPLEYGGYFIYEGKKEPPRRDVKAWIPGDVPAEAERLVLDHEESDETTYTVYQIVLEPLKLVDDYLVPLIYKRSWPHPVERYDAWFHKHLAQVAEFVGTSEEELEKDFTSRDPLVRADAYRAIGDYFGWDELDSDPLRGLSRDAVEERYRKELSVGHRT